MIIKCRSDTDTGRSGAARLPREWAGPPRWTAGGEGAGGAAGTSATKRGALPAVEPGKEESHDGRRDDEGGGMTRRPGPRRQGSRLLAGNRRLVGPDGHGGRRDRGQRTVGHLQTGRPTTEAMRGTQADQQQQAGHPGRAQAPVSEGGHPPRVDQRPLPRPTRVPGPRSTWAWPRSAWAAPRHVRVVSPPVPPPPPWAGSPGSGSCQPSSRCAARRIRPRQAGPATCRDRP